MLALPRNRPRKCRTWNFLPKFPSSSCLTLSGAFSSAKTDVLARTEFFHLLLAVLSTRWSSNAPLGNVGNLGLITPNVLFAFPIQQRLGKQLSKDEASDGWRTTNLEILESETSSLPTWLQRSVVKRGAKTCFDQMTLTMINLACGREGGTAEISEKG